MPHTPKCQEGYKHKIPQVFQLKAAVSIAL